MADGRVQEIGAPDEIFDRPTVRRTREFLARIPRQRERA